MLKIERKYCGEMSDLTEKQKRFARGIFDGLSQREAYREAYDCSAKKDHSIDTLASKLLKKVEVREYLDELNRQVETSKIMSKQERMEYLSRVIRTPIGKLDESSDMVQEASVTETTSKLKMPSKIDAIRELNRMDGAYEPEKVEVKHALSFDKLMDEIGRDERII